MGELIVFLTTPFSLRKHVQSVHGCIPVQIFNSAYRKMKNEEKEVKHVDQRGLLNHISSC